MITPEGYTKRRVKLSLEKHNAYQFWPVQTGYGSATLDCIACINGNFIGIETKREGVRKPTARQALVMSQIRAAKGKTFLVTMDGDKVDWIEITE